MGEKGGIKDLVKEKWQKFSTKWHEKYSPLQDFLLGDLEEPRSKNLRTMYIGAFPRFGEPPLPRPRKKLTLTGWILKKISELKRVSAEVGQRAEKILRENRFIRGFDKTFWQEHMSMSLNEMEHGLCRPQKGSFGFLFTLAAKEGVPIADLQNSYIAKSLYETFKHIRDTKSIKAAEDNKLVPKLIVNVKKDGSGNIRDVTSPIEMKGTPIKVRILRGKPPVDFVDVVFKDITSFTQATGSLQRGERIFDEPTLTFEEAKSVNSFEQIDYKGIMRGDPIPYIGQKNSVIQATEPRALAEWYDTDVDPTRGGEIGQERPDVVIGPGNKNFRMDDFMADFEPQLYFEVGEEQGQVASLGVYANNHFARNGGFFVGGEVWDRKTGRKNKKPSMHELVMDDKAFTSKLERTSASEKLCYQYLQDLGEFQPRTVPIFTYLSHKLVNRVGDSRQKIENWLALNQFQSEAIRDFAVKFAGVHRIQASFLLPDLLNEMTKKIPKIPEINERNIKSILIPALAQYLTTERMTGIDVGTPDNGLDMSTIGWDIVENLREIVDEQKSREINGMDYKIFPHKLTELFNSSEKLSKQLEDISTGKQAGAAKINAENGILQPLEILAIKLGAEIIPGLQRVSQHVSKLVSRQIENMPTIFRSALGADGTGKNIALLNNIFNYEATIDDHFEVFDILLPYVRGNSDLKYSFRDFVEESKEFQIDEQDGDEEKKRELKSIQKQLVNMIMGEDYACFTDPENIHNPELKKMRGSKLHNYGKIWDGGYELRRFVMGADADVRLKDKQGIEIFVEMFNKYSEWLSAQNLEGTREREVEAYKDIVNLREGGFIKIWDAMAQMTINKFQYEYANVVLIFAGEMSDQQELEALRKLRKDLLAQFQGSHQTLAKIMTDLTGTRGSE